MQTPTAVRFVSVEPMLGPINFGNVPGFNKCGQAGVDLVKNFWVICGCESGPGAREMDPSWARSLKDQCVTAGVPFFFKQAKVAGKMVKMPKIDGRIWDQYPGEDRDG